VLAIRENCVDVLMSYNEVAWQNTPVNGNNSVQLKLEQFSLPGAGGETK
jgi:hypothetical protein